MSELKGILTERETLIGTLSLGADYFKGDRGESGVYVGEEQPTDEEITIWIEPDGEATDELVSKEELEEALENIEVPDLSDYAKVEDIPDVSNLASKDEIPDISNLATKEDIPDISNLASKDEIPDVSGFQTAEQVETAITQALNKIGVAEEGAY